MARIPPARTPPTNGTTNGEHVHEGGDEAAVEAAALVASTDVEAAIAKALAQVSAEALAAQRKNQINALWERMQAVLAFVSVLVADTAALVIIWRGGLGTPDPSPLVIAALLALTSSSSLVIGFYFGRTNHSRPTNRTNDE